MCLNIGSLNNHHFPFGTNGKVVVLGVPILKHFRVLCHKMVADIMGLCVYSKTMRRASSYYLEVSLQ